MIDSALSMQIVALILRQGLCGYQSRQWQTETRPKRRRLEGNMSNNMTSQQAQKILNEYLSLDSDLDNESINPLRVLNQQLQAELIEIQIEFEEKYWRDTQGYIIKHNAFNSGIEICVDIIQEKINALKAEVNDT